MSHVHLHKPHHPNNDVPEELEPDALPVEPDEGPVPALIPDDPENDRVNAPVGNHARQAQRPRRELEVA